MASSYWTPSDVVFAAMAPHVELPRQASGSITSPVLKAKKTKSRDSGRTREREAEEEESFFGDFCLKCVHLS